MEPLLQALQELAGWIVGESPWPDGSFSFFAWLLLPATLGMVLVIGLQFLFPAAKLRWSREPPLAIPLETPKAAAYYGAAGSY